MIHIPIPVEFLADAASVIQNSANEACGTSCNNTSTVPGLFKSIANVLTFLIGAISVVMVIVGGLRYVLSDGDPKKTGQAKDTILYAAIGVAISIVSYAIVNFVLSSVK